MQRSTQDAANKVVVTGAGAITPIGNDAETYWRNLIAGKSGAAPIEGFDSADLPVTIAAEVKDFTAREYIDPKAARRMDRFSQFAVAASKEALENACFEITPENAGRVGVLMNTGGGGIPAIVREVLNHHNKGPSKVSPFFIPTFAPNMAAAQVSLIFGVRGPVMAAVAACAAGAQAFIDGMHLLRRGEADLVIAGGTEAALDPVAVAAFSNMHALSRRNDDPERASRPFDADRDGFVFGEGCGALILETEAHALARGARIICEVAGGSMTADAYHITAPEPDGTGAITAMTQAVERSGIDFDEVDCLYAHATSTPIGDAAESKAIQEVFGSHATRIAVSSPKSMIGHLVGASGAVNAVAAIFSIRDQIVAPSINLDNPDPEYTDINYVANTAREMPVKTVMTNSFGFGGQNVVSIFRAYE